MHAHRQDIPVQIAALRDSEAFARNHPDLSEWEEELAGTFTTCLGRNAPAGFVSLETIYDHIFVSDGGCERCRKTMEGKQNRRLFRR